MKNIRNYIIASGIVALFAVLSTAFAPAPDTDADIAFNISIQKDASISISSLCTNDGTSVLRFTPSINLISEDSYALPTNDCNDAAAGHWNITNIGNIDLTLSMQLQNALPDYVTSEVGDVLTPYNDADYEVVTELSSVEWPDTIVKATTVDFYQRIAAGVLATGGTNQTSNKVLITSEPAI